MKHKTKLKNWLAVSVIGAGMLAFVALANNWAFASLAPAPGLTSVTNAVLTNYAGAAFQVPGNQTLLITAQVYGNVSNVQPATIGWDVTPDGTNWSTTQPYKFTNNLPGVTNGGLPMFFTADMLRGVFAIKPTYFSAVSATAITNYGFTIGYYY